MPHYRLLKHWSDRSARDRVVDRILALREQLQKDVSAFKSDGSLMLATWNIRDFDSNKFKHGPRLKESFHYIAEIIAAFDLIAVQEVNRDLRALKTVVDLLGEPWDYITTDATEGTSGNQERMAFLFDRRKVSFRHVAGEIVLPKGRKIVSAKTIKDRSDPAKVTIEEDELQFARTPFVVAFQAGWFRFNLCTVHIYYGSASGGKLKRRIEEIKSIAKFFSKRQKKEKEDYILLGDFNIVSPEHKTMEALEREGFVIPEDLKDARTNLGGDRHYDQIAFRVKTRQLELGASGVFDFRQSVFRDEDFETYFDRMPAGKRDVHVSGVRKGQPRTPAEKREYYRDEWRTWQMSDHLLMWVQLKVDFSNDYLLSLKSGGTPLSG